MSTKADVRVRRVYDKAEDQDGVRVLVDHIWPRGVSKAKVALTDCSPAGLLRRSGAGVPGAVGCLLDAAGLGVQHCEGVLGTVTAVDEGTSVRPSPSGASPLP